MTGNGLHTEIVVQENSCFSMVANAANAVESFRKSVERSKVEREKNVGCLHSCQDGWMGRDSLASVFPPAKIENEKKRPCFIWIAVDMKVDSVYTCRHTPSTQQICLLQSHTARLIHWRLDLFIEGWKPTRQDHSVHRFKSFIVQFISLINVKLGPFFNPHLIASLPTYSFHVSSNLCFFMFLPTYAYYAVAW